jgi:hypothetical protein
MAVFLCFFISTIYDDAISGGSRETVGKIKDEAIPKGY